MVNAEGLESAEDFRELRVVRRIGIAEVRHYACSVDEGRGGYGLLGW